MGIVGRQINNYEVRHLIGEGGMGAVYLAEHVIMGRKAAVKVLRGEFADDEMLIARFINEARAANAIGHPNIVDVVDVGRLPDGIPYMMMEYLEGENLAKRLGRDGRLSPAVTLHLAAQAASALEAAHQKGIVHRDLKPENLFLIPDPAHPGQQRVKVLDFGIAKLRGTFSKGDSMKTRTGSLMGTPPYMSPEQCRGISDAMDHRSDIYSFGIILYEMAVGRPPFVSEGFGEILMMHMQTPPAPPSSLCPDIPPAFEYTILRALAKEPGQRFSSMGELLAALTSKTCPPLPLSDNSGGSSRKETLVLPEAGPGQAEYPEPESQDGILNSAEESAEREAVRTALVYKRRNVMIGGALAGVAVIALVGYLVFGGSKHPARSPGPLADTKKASPSEIVVPPAQPVVPPVVNKPVLASPDPAAKPEPEPAKPVAKRGPADDRPAESRRHSRPKPVERPTSKPAGDDSVEKW